MLGLKLFSFSDFLRWLAFRVLIFEVVFFFLGIELLSFGYAFCRFIVLGFFILEVLVGFLVVGSLFIVRIFIGSF